MKTKKSKKKLTLKDIFLIENAIYQERIEQTLSRIKERLGENNLQLTLLRFAKVCQMISDIVKKSKEPPRLLDVGCGAGYLLTKLGRICDNSTLIGVDFSKGRLQIAHERGVWNLVDACAEKLPFRPNTFSIIVSTETLEHIIKPDEMLSEIESVLKKNGFLILTVPSLHLRWKSRSPMTHIFRALLSLYNPSYLPQDEGILKPHTEKMCNFWNPTKNDVIIHRSYSLKGLKTMLSAHRFHVVKLETIIFTPILGRIDDKLLLIEQRMLSKIRLLRNLGQLILCVCKKQAIYIPTNEEKHK